MENKKVVLSADSTCDLGNDLKERYQVEYYPYHIILEGQDYRDNVDITTEEIYQRYYEKKVLPKTAAINVDEYLRYFKKWSDQGYEVVHVNLGGALSSSYQNARLAAQELVGVYVVDSCNLSTGMGLLLLEAGEMIKRGMSAKETAGQLELIKSRCHASFILDTLTFMHAGGRCSSIVALGAGVLNLKPCIEVDNRDGSMKVGRKYRGNLDKVLVKYVKDKLFAYPDIKKDHIFITHSGIDESYIRLVKETIEKEANFKEIHVTKASCTISCHCGPNTLGILFETEAS